MKTTITWAMPNKWTFSIPPVQEFVEKYLENSGTIVDPFSGCSTYATHSNDLAISGIKSEEWLPPVKSIDCLLFDPPYSPRQISEVYKGLGLPTTIDTTQNSRLYSRVLKNLLPLVKVGGLVLKFGWQTGGLGKNFKCIELLVVQHGGGHNDTLCTAHIKQTK